MSFLTRYFSFINDAKDVLALFNNQYLLLPALTAPLEDEAYRLRHKVYCDELGYEDTTVPNVERDQFDPYSTQIVMQYKPLKAYIGVARFIHPRQKGRTIQLPIETLCGDKLNTELVQRIKDSGVEYAELSRLAVDKSFRHMGQTVRGRRSMVRSSCAALAMFMGIQSFSKIHNIKFLLAIVEKKLLNSFTKLNIPFERLGDPVQHRGTRYPIVIDIEKSFETFPPALMGSMCRKIESGMRKMIEVHKAQQDDVIKIVPLVADHDQATVVDFTDRNVDGRSVHLLQSSAGGPFKVREDTFEARASSGIMY